MRHPLALDAGAEEQTLSPGLVSIVGTLVLTLIVLLMVWRDDAMLKPRSPARIAKWMMPQTSLNPRSQALIAKQIPEADNIEDSTEAPVR